MPETRTPHWRLARLATAWSVALSASASVLVAWFRPDALAPLALAWCACAVWLPGIRAQFTPRVLVAIIGLLLFIATKDLLFPGPFASELSRLDPATSPPRARQPDWPRVLVSLGGLAAILLVIPALRALLAGPENARAASLGMVAAVAGLACALLTHPAEASRYGRDFQLGSVASRNPAAGAFALGALIALGAGLSAHRDRKKEALPAFAASALCAAAVGALGSRGGLLALGAGALLLSYQENKYKTGRAAALLGGVFIALLLFAPGPLSRLAAEGDGYRLELAGATLRALALAPWGGLGLGGFAPGFALFGGLVPAEGMRAIHPDCGWMLLLCEWGVLGLVALALTGVALLKPASPAGDRPAQPAATAALVAWMVAAVGDISFHRVELLVLGLPLLAQRFPARNTSTRAPLPLLGPSCASILAVATLVSIFYGRHRVDEALDPAASAAAGSPAVLPLDPAARHLAGNHALARGDLPRAAVEYTVAAALDPANSIAIEAYARAIAHSRPDLALPLWRRLFEGASERAQGLLKEELTRVDAPDASYWLRALPERPTLWILPADSDLRGAQSAYEKWLRLPASIRAASPWQSVLGASARWGTAKEFAAWLSDVKHASTADAAANGGELLSRRGRDDLAWLWLNHALPAPPTSPGRAPDPALKAVVLANPSDTVAAMRLVEQTNGSAERLALLKTLNARANAPATFRLLLARELDAAGRRPEALAELQAAAVLLADEQRARSNQAMLSR